MKILFVRTYCPYSIFYGSEMRSSRFVDYLRSLGDVDLLTLTKPYEKTDMDYVRRQFKQFYFLDEHAKHSRMSMFEKILHLLPWQLREHYMKDCQQKVADIIEVNQYDLIFIFKLEPIFYFLQLPRKWHKKIVIDFDDILSDLHGNYHKNNPFTAFRKSFLLKRYENMALKFFKRVFVCSRDAKSKVKTKYQDKVGVIPNIFQADLKSFKLPSQNIKKLLFVGSLDYFANTEGLRWFFDKVWPGFKEQFPNVGMSVVGKTHKDVAYIAALLGNPKDVTISLNVPSVESFYEDHFLSVVPLLNGSGTRLKILESAAYGRPVLTTAVGMEGLDFENGKNIFVFNDAGSFANGYKELLDAKRYIEITQDAAQVLRDRYSLDTFVSAMNENRDKINK